MEAMRPAHGDAFSRQRADLKDNLGLLSPKRPKTRVAFRVPHFVFAVALGSLRAYIRATNEHPNRTNPQTRRRLLRVNRCMEFLQ
jgi:hypothetical protein